MISIPLRIVTKKKHDQIFLIRLQPSGCFYSPGKHCLECLIRTCIGPLLAFTCIHHSLLFVSAIVHSERLSSIAQEIPRNIKQLRTIAGIDVDSFTNFVSAHSVILFMIHIHGRK